MIHSLFALPLLLLAPAATDWSQAEAVTVTISNFEFAPKRIDLQPGHAYRLHLVNAASGGHNFDAPQFFAAATIDPDDSGRIKDGKVEVGGGQAADVRFVAPAAGDYALRCSHLLHSGFGMKGVIAVH